jgi:hypothetical protein
LPDSGWKWPAAHATQRVAFEVSLVKVYVPARQTEQICAPRPPYWPSRQAMQSRGESCFSTSCALSVMKVLMGHATQRAAPYSCMYWPASHTSQSSATTRGAGVAPYLPGGHASSHDDEVFRVW